MRNVEDALRLVPGVRVQDESGTGILPNIGVRGLDPRRSQRTLVLVDGIPIALAPYGQTGLSLFPLTMQTVESIDVARGGVAVRYGPNNVGGVINFISKPIPETFSTTLKEALTIASETGNVLTDSYLRVGGFVTERLGLQFQANTVLGDSFRSHSDTEVENLTADAQWFLTDTASLKALIFGNGNAVFIEQREQGLDMPAFSLYDVYERPDFSKLANDHSIGRTSFILIIDGLRKNTF